MRVGKRLCKRLDVVQGSDQRRRISIGLIPPWYRASVSGMRIIALSTLRTFWEKYPDAETPLRAWYALASRALWKTPADIKLAYWNASVTANNRVVFNIKGNDYRLVVGVRFDKGLMYIRFIGTHRQYDRIEVETM